MTGPRIRIQIDYRSESSGKWHRSECLVSSSLELMDRFLRLRTKAADSMHVSVKLRGTHVGWKMVATSSSFYSGHFGAELFDIARFPDKEYMEGVLVSAYERAVRAREKDDPNERGIRVMGVGRSVETTKKEYEYRREHLVKVGMLFTPKWFVRFTDGTCHIPGQRYVVTEDNVAYYVVNLSSYRRVIG